MTKVRKKTTLKKTSTKSQTNNILINIILLDFRKKVTLLQK